MKKVLIINLKKLGDIFLSAHFAALNLDSEIKRKFDLLCYEESRAAAKLSLVFSNVHYIDRKNLANLLNNPLFPSFFALEELLEILEKIEVENYDEVLNVSNDPVAGALSSYLKERNPNLELRGFYYQDHTVNYLKELRPRAFNDLLSKKPRPFIHFLEAHTIAMPSAQKSPLKRSSPFRVAEERREEARGEFEKIRTVLSDNGELPRLIGIQLCAGEERKSPSFSELCEILDTLIEMEGHYPILLIGPFEHERKVAAELNNFFDSKLAVMESDFLALSSAILELDALITPDTAVKHLATAARLPVIELSKNEDLARSFFSYQQNAITILQKEDNPPYQEFLGDCLKALFLKEHLLQINAPQSVSVYIHVKDYLGIHLSNISGFIDEEKEISYLLERALLIEYLAGKSEKRISEGRSIKRELEIFSAALNERISRSIKLAGLSLGKHILAGLRLLRTYIENSSENTFVSANAAVEIWNTLATLFEEHEKNCHFFFAVRAFETSLENLRFDSSGQNLSILELKKIEKYLFELKKDIQFQINVCSQLLSERTEAREGVVNAG